MRVLVGRTAKQSTARAVRQKRRSIRWCGAAVWQGWILGAQRDGGAASLLVGRRTGLQRFVAYLWMDGWMDGSRQDTCHFSFALQGFQTRAKKKTILVRYGIGPNEFGLETCWHRRTTPRLGVRPQSFPRLLDHPVWFGLRWIDGTRVGRRRSGLGDRPRSVLLRCPRGWVRLPFRIKTPRRFVG